MTQPVIRSVSSDQSNPWVADLKELIVLTQPYRWFCKRCLQKAMPSLCVVCEPALERAASFTEARCVGWRDRATQASAEIPTTPSTPSSHETPFRPIISEKPAPVEAVERWLFRQEFDRADGGRGRQATWAHDGGRGQPVTSSILSIHQGHGQHDGRVNLEQVG